MNVQHPTSNVQHPMALVPYDPLFAAWQRGQGGPMVRKVFSWGGETIVKGDHVEQRFEGVSSVLVFPTPNGGGPSRRTHIDQDQYPFHGFSCLGCPYFGVSEHQWGSCAHPLWLELFGCPQSLGKAVAGRGPDSDCPALGRGSERAQRRYRWHIKSKAIFWDYYYHAGMNPRRHGFDIFPFRISEHV